MEDQLVEPNNLRTADDIGDKTFDACVNEGACTKHVLKPNDLQTVVEIEDEAFKGCCTNHALNHNDKRIAVEIGDKSFDTCVNEDCCTKYVLQPNDLQTVVEFEDKTFKGCCTNHALNQNDKRIVVEIGDKSFDTCVNEGCCTKHALKQKQLRTEVEIEDKPTEAFGNGSCCTKDASKSKNLRRAVAVDDKSFEENGGENRCRICLENEASGPMIAPCYCTGTIGFVHASCLQKWMNVKHTGKCEICNYHYKTEVSLPPVRDWMLNYQNKSVFKRQITDLICFLLLAPMVTACTWMSFNSALDLHVRKDMQTEMSLLICLTVLLLTVFSIWGFIVTRYHIKSWWSWRDSHMIYELRVCSFANVAIPPVTGDAV